MSRSEDTQDVCLPFSAWYGDYKVPVRFPRNWEIHVCKPKWEPEIKKERISESFESPYGTERLRELAKGRKTAAIIVDCIARPTPASKILPFVVNELKKGGIEKSNIKIIIGMGAHRPLTMVDMRKKLGEEFAMKYYVANHNIFDNLTYLGKTSRGTPIYLNTDVMNSELKVGISSIIPHPLAGFGGGAKIVLPGVAGVETIEYNHHHLIKDRTLGAVEKSAIRLDIEEVAEKAGLDFIANVLVNADRKITRVFTGHFIKAHRAGVEVSEAIYKTNLPDEYDILLANAYPLDVYLLQTGKALWPAERMKEDGIVILSAACTEGMGVHYVHERMKSKGMLKMVERQIRRETIIYSGNVGVRELEEVKSIWHINDIAVMKSWDSLFKKIQANHKKKMCVAVLPCSSIQF